MSTRQSVSFYFIILIKFISSLHTIMMGILSIIMAVSVITLAVNL